jgi:hypothetical protein
MLYFGRFETVIGMQISRDRKGWTKGFGYISLKNKSQIEDILASDHKIFGKMVSILGILAFENVYLLGLDMEDC